MFARNAIAMILLAQLGCGATSRSELTSKAFGDGKPIPAEYTGDGADRSPPLAWNKLPAGTRELALVCDDPDAPGSAPWVHWVLYKIPATTSSLPAGLPTQATLQEPAGALQGANSWGADSIGYRGPAPPPKSGSHHYRFQLYALDAPLNLPPASTDVALRKAMQGHILGEARLTGLYSR